MNSLANILETDEVLMKDYMKQALMSAAQATPTDAAAKGTASCPEAEGHGIFTIIAKLTASWIAVIEGRYEEVGQETSWSWENQIRYGQTA